MSTIKYTIGEDVYFETIRVVPELSALVYQGVSPWSIGQELRPFAKNGAAAGTQYDSWPGRLRIPAAIPTGASITNVPGDRWDRYNPSVYAYPPGYPSAPLGQHSQVFPVNRGHLSVWWWNPTALVEKEEFPYAIYWPSLVCDYRNDWPDAPPQLVIASFQGSAYGGLFDDNTRSLLFTQGPATVQATAVVTNNPPGGWGNPTYSRGFTFETWVRPTVIAGYNGIMSMTSANGSNALSLYVKDGLVGAAVFGYSGGILSTQSWSATTSVVTQDWAHIGLVYTTNGVLKFYVDASLWALNRTLLWTLLDTSPIQWNWGQCAPGHWVA
jgi:hypothetical protein